LAAVAVKEEGYSVIIVEPGRWVGGILGAGIKPLQDCPNFEAVSGKTREYMKFSGTGSTDNSHSISKIRKMIREISPKTVREDFLKILKQNNIDVIYDHRIRISQNINESCLKRS
jgi:hypothetical protein